MEKEQDLDKIDASMKKMLVAMLANNVTKENMQHLLKDLEKITNSSFDDLTLKDLDKMIEKYTGPMEQARDGMIKAYLDGLGIETKGKGKTALSNVSEKIKELMGDDNTKTQESIAQNDSIKVKLQDALDSDTKPQPSGAGTGGSRKRKQKSKNKTIKKYLNRFLNPDI